MPLKNEAKRKYQREWVAKRRAEFFNGKQCFCGSDENLQLDHKDPSKKVSHRIWSWSKERRDCEIEKCQVLCIVCHKDKTRKQLVVKEHGLTMYQKHGCRCEICRYAHTKRWRDYRIKLKKNTSVA